MTFTGFTTLPSIKQYYLFVKCLKEVAGKQRAKKGQGEKCGMKTAIWGKVRSQKKKRYHLGIFPNLGGGVFPNPKTFVNLPSIFLYAKFILRC